MPAEKCQIHDVNFQYRCLQVQAFVTQVTHYIKKYELLYRKNSHAYIEQNILLCVEIL